ncbi:MAG: hypothetical protein H0T46_07270 [Deltaproteobacteria bacterium]|nr:hypothetical protein [Deltaproteobacteria bacterium]
MKRSKQCPKCDSLRIGHVATQIDARHVQVDHGSDKVGPGVPIVVHHMDDSVVPRMVGESMEVIKTGTFVLGDVSRLLGKLEAYVCADCGLYESYVQDPQAVQWRDIVGFSWVNEALESDGTQR